MTSKLAAVDWGKWARHMVSFLAGCGLLVAIGHGLLGAGGLRADVEALKKEAPVARQVAADVAGIKATIAAVKEEQSQQREDAKDRALVVDGKLDMILDRLTRP